MFEETTYEVVVVKVKQQQKQAQIQLQIALNEDNEVYVLDIIRSIKPVVDIGEGDVIFYFDPLKNMYANLQQQQIVYLPFSYLALQNVINLRVESRMSDQLLANPPPKNETSRSKRSPERHICQVFQLVETWRSLYTRGTINQKGELQKVTLEKAALITGVPRKSLEDYYLLLRNGYGLRFDFNANSRKKVGVLRNFVKEQKKKVKMEQVIEKQKIKSQPKYDEIVLTEIRKQIFGMSEKEYEQQLFRVVSNASSDEDQCSIIFQN